MKNVKFYIFIIRTVHLLDNVIANNVIDDYATQLVQVLLLFLSA